jgi:preprotein translocase subunit SecG
MTYLLIGIHIIVSIILILVVLLQTGKRADLAGAFGGGGSQTVFGARGAATFLSKATTISAIVFMFTSLALSLLSSPFERRGRSVLPADKPGASAPLTPGPAGKPAPAAPAAPAPAQSAPARPAPTTPAPAK